MVFRSEAALLGFWEYMFRILVTVCRAEQMCTSNGSNVMTSVVDTSGIFTTCSYFVADRRT
jgi:hypothetical protein